MKKTLLVYTLALALVFALAACGKAPAAKTPAPTLEPETAAETPAPASEEPVAAPTPEPTSAPSAEPVRQNGERFEKVITILGMEQTAQFEHVRNEAFGFEMDYDYEAFKRDTNAQRVRFASVWDDPANPENYLELSSSDEDAETVAAAITEQLSQEYEIYRDTYELARAGSCIRIIAEVIRGTNNMADYLQEIYILPASDGCRIARVHCFIVESEGFFKHVGYMLDTLSVID